MLLVGRRHRSLYSHCVCTFCALCECWTWCVNYAAYASFVSFRLLLIVVIIRSYSFVWILCSLFACYVIRVLLCFMPVHTLVICCLWNHFSHRLRPQQRRKEKALQMRNNLKLWRNLKLWWRRRLSSWKDAWYAALKHVYHRSWSHLGFQQPDGCLEARI